MPTKVIVRLMGDGTRMNFECECPRSRLGDHPSAHLQTAVLRTAPEPISVNRTLNQS